MELELGPVCRAKLGISIATPAAPRTPAAGSTRGPTRARWSFVLEGDDFVLLEDLGGATSVTNDAEAVVAELARRCPLAGRRVLYRDSEGRWDELLVEGGRFKGFAPIRAKTQREAVEVARALGTKLAGVRALRSALTAIPGGRS